MPLDSFFELRLLQWALERQGYTVIVDDDCTRDEALNALKDKRTQVFIFFGHAGPDVLEMIDEDVHPSDVQQALSGRRLERVELWGCNTESDEWRQAFGNPTYFDGSKGLYNPIFGIDRGNLLGKRPEKPKDRQEKKRRGTTKKRSQ